MTSGCPPIEQLEELIALDAGDPRRTHLESCPRCRSRMLAFRSFMEMHPVPDGARLEDARKQLSGVLREEAARAREAPFAEAGRSSDARSAEAGPALQVPSAAERRPRRGLLDRLAPRQWQFAFGLAALAVAVVVIVHVTKERQDGTPLHMRGPVETEVTAGPPLHSVRADGALELRWAAVEGAEAYRLVFSGPDLREILRVEAGAETRHVLPAETVAGLGSAGSVVFWRVLALRGGDAIAQSPPATLRLP